MGGQSGCRYQAEVSWRDVTGFSYKLVGLSERVVAHLADGSRVLLWGSGRTMRWSGGGKTTDFAALLTERARNHGSSITSA